MTNKQRLKALKKLLRYPKNWTRDAFARLKSGHPCEPKSALAASWCLYGGCECVGIENPAPLFRPVIVKGIAHFNDSPDTTHKDLLKVIDKAIQLCKT